MTVIVKRYMSVAEIADATVRAAEAGVPRVLVGAGRCDSADCEPVMRQVFVVAGMTERQGTYCAECAVENARAVAAC